jgi:3-deoxy-D-manno-octulosonic-acid transferase
MRALYTLIVRLIAPFMFVLTALRGWRDPAYRDRLPERFGFTHLRAAIPHLWLHAVSVGEVQAAAPLIRALLERLPQFPLLITTTTPTGAARVRETYGDRVQHCYLPYDTPGSVQRFLLRTRPRIAIIVETELWPNLYDACARSGIAVIIASARISPRSFPRYRRFASLFKESLSNITVAAQTEEDAARFRAIGASDVLVSGNIKFDIEVSAAVAEAGRQFRANELAGRPTWIAASTHEGEEAAALEAHQRIQAETSENCVLILVPRHPQRFAAVKALLVDRRTHFVCRSSAQSPDASTQVFLVDTMGELVKFLAAGDVAFIAGSLVPVGGHNFLEAAALGLPILSGPFVFNAQAMSDTFFDAGAAIKVNSTGELASAVIALLKDPQRREDMGLRGRQLIERNRGAVSRIVDLIVRQLGDSTGQRSSSG